MTSGVDDVARSLLARVGEATPEPRLTATRRTLALLGDPHLRTPFIHITGTNGKTSTGRIAAELLRTTGERVGLFTSPHLVSIAERIAINGTAVGAQSLRSAWSHIAPALAIVDAELEASGSPPVTYFEALTVLCFQTFAMERVTAAVVEVGMGGEWDSTNVADGRVAVFTPIALDHTRQLGRTVAAIARTKAGIIKPGATVVSALQEPAAAHELAARAGYEHARLFWEGESFAGRTLSLSHDGQVIEIARLGGAHSRAALSLHGAHQASNAALAVAAVDAFLESPLSIDGVRRGLAKATSPGRLEIIARDPLTIIDAAHNPAGAATAATALEMWKLARVIVVLAVLDEKDAAGIVRALARLRPVFIVTRSSSPRSLSAAHLSEIVSAAGGDVVEVRESASEAVGTARLVASTSPAGAILITGSITLIGDVLSATRAVEVG